MLQAAFRALGDLLSPEFRAIFWRAVGLTFGLFVLLFAIVMGAFWFLTLVPWPWMEALLAVGAGLGLLVVFFFLMAPVTALFAGLYLDDVAARVEARHYPQDRQGAALATWSALRVSLQFGALVLLINILALPFVFTGIGAAVLLLVNAYLISREYFEMVAMRFMPVDQARDLRRSHAMTVLTAGAIPALMSLVPILNLAVPLFSTSYFTHLFKRVQRS